MAYKSNQSRPYQYLLTFPKGTKQTWDKLTQIAKKQGRPVSELARQVIKNYVDNDPNNFNADDNED